MLPRLLFLIMLAVYGSLILHAQDFPSGEIEEIIWFIQSVTWTLIVTCLMLGALIAENQRHERNVLQKEKGLLESQFSLERAQLTTLRYQLNPHFLFNSLNSISAVIPPNLKQPRKMISHLTSYFRSTLELPEGELISVAHEIERLQQYLEIEKVRYGDLLQLSVKIDPEVRDQKIPFFLLQPLVENAVRHGIEAAQDCFLLEIRAFLGEQGFFILEVENPGFWQEDPERERAGIGLENVKKRLDLIFGGLAVFEKHGKQSRMHPLKTPLA
jgi:LytS/YehU family sensor histidine kinase